VVTTFPMVTLMHVHNAPAQLLKWLLSREMMKMTSAASGGAFRAPWIRAAGLPRGKALQREKA